MGNYVGRFVSLRFAEYLTLAFSVLVIAAFPLCASTQSFNVPNDVALRIRLGDTLTSVDSEVGDLFSATDVDNGDYQNARVYGHIDHVGIGSDFDGISATANGLGDISKMPALVAVLLERDYSETDLKKILGENHLRVVRGVTGS